MRMNGYTAAFLLLGLIGCGDEAVESDEAMGRSEEPTPDPDLQGPYDGPFVELFDQGIGRYLGVFTPTTSTSSGPGVTNYVFDVSDDGPKCFTGETFNMTTRDGSGSELMIFLQGGGFCAPTNCEAVDTTSGVPPLGILSPATPDNPTAEYDVGYLPYCDGTLFAGDRDVDGRSFRGLQNLSASLDVIANSYPNPSRILLIGNSAGGSATHYALPLVRRLYPTVAIDLVNDSGPGILNPGSQEMLNEYWNSGAFFPESCENCIGEDGNLTDYYAYQLSEDSNLRMGYISSKRDEVIVESLGGDGAAFEEEMLTSVAELNQAHPERFRSLVANGDEHTFVLRQFNYAIAGTTVRQWITEMLNGGEAWVSLSD